MTWHEESCYPGEPVFALDAATLEERAGASVPHRIPSRVHIDQYVRDPVRRNAAGSAAKQP